VPSLLLSEAALALMRDLFALPDLFADAPRVRRRLVVWGGAPVMVPHEAVLASEERVQAALGVSEETPMAAPDFTIHAAPPLPMGELHVFGERHAVAARVRLRDPVCRAEGRVEAVESGWLFLVPADEEEGWLLGVGSEIDALLAQSRLIAPVVDPIGGSSRPFLAAPRLHLPLVGDDWLACGTAAIGFDPICGDGTAQAVREAILASAAITAMRDGEDAAAVRLHYESMLIAAMRRHLKLCGDFYLSGGQGPWWQAQFAALKTGHEQCTRRLAVTPEPRYALQGFNLIPRRIAA